MDEGLDRVNRGEGGGRRHESVKLTEGGRNRKGGNCTGVIRLGTGKSVWGLGTGRQNETRRKEGKVGFDVQYVSCLAL